MLERLTIRDAQQERRLFRGRLYLAVAMMITLGAVLLAGIAHLQLVRGLHYSTLSKENRVKVAPVAPTRGLIYSQDGFVLAQNRPSYSLELIPELTADIPATLEELRPLIPLSEGDIERFQSSVKRQRRFESVPLKLNLSEDEVARIAVNKHRWPGLNIEARLVRQYPYGPATAHVVGYVGRIDSHELRSIDSIEYSGTTYIGKTGVEKSYEHLLHGKVGHQQVEVDALGRVIRVLEGQAPVPGKDLYLTLHLGLQRKAQAALADRRGAIVALDPNTGGVLAMVSTPGFDPELFVNGIDEKAFAALGQSSDQALFNRALQGQYPPGSTIKPFLALAAQHAGLLTDRQVSWCPGWYVLSGDAHRYRDWKRSGHGRMNMRLAIAESCDVYFYELAFRLGIDRIYEFLVNFGFGGQTGIDLPGEASGLVPSREWKRKARSLPWFPGETLITGIGQGFTLTTPLQLAVAASALGTRGTLVTPRILDRTEDPISGDQAEYTDTPSILALPVAPAHYQAVIDGMEMVVHSPFGTAHEAGFGAAYRFAGKTGTAQLFGLSQEEEAHDEKLDQRLRDHALFVAFAPVQDPLLTLVIVVENGGSGSTAAAPIARLLFDYYFQDSLAGLQTSGHG